MKTNESKKQAMVQEAEAILMQLIEQLQEVDEGELEQVEQTVLHSCVEVGRKWMEHVLEPREPDSRPAARREGACGHRQRLVGDRPKELLTLLGKVTVSRPYYQCLREEGEQERAVCSHGEIPWDRRWGVQGRRTSPGVQKLVSYLAASMTLEETVQVFERVVPVKMSERQALNLLQPVGEHLIALEKHEVKQMEQAACQARTQHDREARALAEQTLQRMSIEMDGVYARMRRECMALSQEEEQRAGDVYREVKVGSVFFGETGPERSELVPGVFVDRAGAIEYVARRCTAEEFGPLLCALAQHRGVEQAKHVVVLGDGALWIWNLASEHFPGAVQIVDLWHAREHIWKVANAVFKRGSTEATAWAKQGEGRLVNGEVEALIQLIEALPPIPAEPGASRSIPAIEADYFRSNAERMRYPTFRAQGMQIGSGIAEAACKTVVSTRAKRSGMRWTPAGLDAILALRTAFLNRSFDQRWDLLAQVA